MTAKQIFDARDTIKKIYDFQYWPAATRFYLNSICDRMQTTIFAYISAYNALLERLGGDGDGAGHYEFTGTTAEQYSKELEQLNAQPVDLKIDPEQFMIDITWLSALEKELQPGQRLQLSANDMMALRGVVQIVEG